MTDPRRSQSVATRIADTILRLEAIRDDLDHLHDRCYRNIHPNQKILKRTISTVLKAIHHAQCLEGEHNAALRAGRNTSPDWEFEQTLPNPPA